LNYVNNVNNSTDTGIKDTADGAYNELRLLSLNAARKLLGIRYGMVKNLIKSGKIKFIRQGKRIKIPYQNLEEYITKYSIVVSNNTVNDGIIPVEEIQNQIDSLISEYSKE
jgi:excisionase family DNA binding protein